MEDNLNDHVYLIYNSIYWELQKATSSMRHKEISVKLGIITAEQLQPMESEALIFVDL